MKNSMSQPKGKIRIGLTQGDINGVGMEVIVKSLSNRDILELFTPVIFGNSEIARKAAEYAGLKDFNFVTLKDTSKIADGQINLVETSAQTPNATPGIPSQEGGKAAVEALEAACRAIDDGDIDLLVTAPIDKRSSQSDTFKFPGHTEYLDDKFAVEKGKVLMILADGNLRVSLVTTHVPISKVAEHITRESVAESIKAFERALRMDFGCERPKIAVLSLNPHCGDGGVLGTEEIDFINPAIEECKKEGILAFGPIAADGLFGSGAYMHFDGILAMSHDQGLAPFKALAGSRGVNFTAGLDIIRTSPAHGTAYDKAGKGTADETSMREAIYAAIDIARNRANYLDASENPLEIHTTPQKPQKRQKEKTDEPDHTAGE